MNKSDGISSLLKAFSVFQGNLENVSKQKEGHGYKYADLGSCIDSAKKELAKNGLSVVQLIGADGTGNTTLETILGHSSGEYISTTCIIPIAKLAGGSAGNPAQIMGASITYMRRYQFAAIIGLAQEDDDAQSVTKNKEKNIGTNWYNTFDNDKENMIIALQNGETNKGIIDALKSQGYALNKKVTQQIMELTA